MCRWRKIGLQRKLADGGIRHSRSGWLRFHAPR